MLKESDIKKLGKEKLEELLKELPFLNDVEFLKKEIRKGEIGPDYVVSIEFPEGSETLLVEVKSNGQPKEIQNACNKLLRILKTQPESYGLVIAPYISPRSAEICTEAGIGYMDISGSALLSFKNVYIKKENFNNQFKQSRELLTLYSPKSERILRVLLTYPYQPWKTMPLADTAEVSPGMITRVKKLLDGEGWIETGDKGFMLSDPEALLKSWEQQYSYNRNQFQEYYTLDGTAGFEDKLCDYCSSNEIKAALTGFSAANRLAPGVRYDRAWAYVESEARDRVIEFCGLKPVEKGGNVLLFEPYDDGVLWDIKDVDGFPLVTPVQVYLDLAQYRGRGEEAAQIIFGEVISKAWQRIKQTMKP